MQSILLFYIYYLVAVTQDKDHTFVQPLGFIGLNHGMQSVG